MFSKQVEMQPSDSLNGTLQRELRVLETLTTFYAAAGNAPDSDAGLALMAAFFSRLARSLRRSMQRWSVVSSNAVIRSVFLTSSSGFQGQKRETGMPRCAPRGTSSRVTSKNGPMERGLFGSTLREGIAGTRAADPRRHSTDRRARGLSPDDVRRSRGWEGELPVHPGAIFRGVQGLVESRVARSREACPCGPKFAQLTEQKSLATAIDKPKTEAQRQPVGSPEFRRTVSGIMKHIQGPNKFRRRV